MVLLRLVLIATLATLAAPAPAHAAPGASPAGTWTTRVSCTGGDYDLRVTISSTGADGLAAAFHFSRKVDGQTAVSDRQLRGRYAPPHVLLAYVDQSGEDDVDLTLVSGTPARLTGTLQYCGQVELVRQASDATASLSTSCSIATVAEGFGLLLLAPGAVAGTALILFLIFGADGRFTGTVTAVGWAFGGSGRRVVFTLVLLAAAAGGLLLLVSHRYGTGCPN